MDKSNRKLTNILVTGGSGFIGANFIKYLFNQSDFSGRIINMDKLTYAGNPENLIDIDKKYGKDRYFFEKADICDYEATSKIFVKHEIDTCVHFAAESHVDRSIYGPKDFIETNIMGTFNLLEVARKLWKDRGDILFHHVSTDEVFGSLGPTGLFTEDTPYDPRSPYSASKASSDHLVRSAFHTYGLETTLSNCSNNYGPYQFPEKLIPLMILNIFENKNLPVYGDGKNIRDWLYVDDHAAAIWLILNKGKSGETYNIGGHNEWTNIDIVNKICEICADIQSKNPDDVKKLITYVTDRPGHDRRYAIDSSKLQNELGWKNETNFKKGIVNTIQWYKDNLDWVDHIRKGEYQNWIDKNYEQR